LHQSSTIVRSGGVSKTEHGLGHLSVELGVGISQVGFNVDQFLDVVKVAIHFEDGNIVAEVLLLGVGKLNSGSGAGKLIGGGNPGDGRSFIKEVGGVEVLNTLLLNGTNLQCLLIIGVQVGGQDLNDVVGKLLLGFNEGIKVGLSGFDGGHDGFKGVATLFHITLDLPVELHLGADVKVETEVNEVTDTLIDEGVKALNDNDGGGFNLFGFIECSIDVVVDGLHDGLALLERLDMLEHEIEALLGGVECGKAGDLASSTVVEMVIIKADDGGHVGNEGVGLPSAIAKSTAKGPALITAKGGGDTSHEGRFAAAGVGGKADDDGDLAILQCHLKRRSAKAGVAGHEGRGGGGREGNDGDGKLHGRQMN